MEKIFKSKRFAIIAPIINFVLFAIAGFFLGFVPRSSGYISSYGGSIRTKYAFSFRTAIGVWLIGLAVSFLVFLICVLIQKAFLNDSEEQ